MEVNILDIVTGIVLITSIYLSGRSDSKRFGWALYTVSSILYVFLMYQAKLIGMMIVGIILICLGIKNFIGAYKEKQ